jgi:hypothetical protein
MCLVCLVAFGTCFLILFRHLDSGIEARHINIDFVNKTWKAGVLFFNLNWLLNLTAHCIFVMKYWLVSQKIVSQLTAVKNDGVEKRARLYLFSLLLWVLVS